MAKLDLSALTQMLEEADSNKALLNDLAASVQKFVNTQRKQLEEIEVLLANANAGKLSGKGGKVKFPEFKDKEGKLIKGNTAEGRKLRKEWLANQK
jgi:hypothetical protein